MGEFVVNFPLKFKTKRVTNLILFSTFHAILLNLFYPIWGIDGKLTR